MSLSPLLYQAGLDGVYGNHIPFGPGSITDAEFVYLSGIPSSESISALDSRFRGRPLVCLSGEWEKHIHAQYPDAKVFTRYMMKPANTFNFENETSVPDGFTVSLFDEDAFRCHPFSHGRNYPSFESFAQYGSGAVVRHGGKIVSAASSFLSFNGEVELDVSTDPDYRKKGLASACVSLMLKDCAERGITVHWDAQNEASKLLAEKFGFRLECVYSVYYI